MEFSMELNPRNERTVNDLLKQVAHQGRASIGKWRIAETYGQATFSVTIRRDLRARWDDLLDELEWDKRPILHMADLHGEVILTKSNDYWPDEE
jgi:hypothetical protein